MNRSIVTLLAFLLLASASTAQRQHDIFSSPLTKTIASVVAQTRVITVDALEIQNVVQEKAPRISFTVPMPHEPNLTLTLDRMTVVAPGSRLTVMTNDGPQHSILGTNAVWYRTTLPENGFAVFTFGADGSVTGMIDGKMGRFVIGHKATSSDPQEYIVAREKIQQFSCGTPTEMLSSELDKLIAESHRAVAKVSEDAQAGDTIIMEIAVEADYQLRRKLGTLELATTYVTQLLAILSTIYERELAVKFVITNVRIWDTSNDPYTDNKGIFA
ncbi:MAG: hypothetical protein H7X70_01110, partial [Candidatus Kapabacteria bacterium]|nr:hypothetical protein [Candidatus Kapabacteria bacterium]